MQQENKKSITHTLFQLARFNCTSCLYFFFGTTPGGRTATGDPNGGRGPIPGNAGGGGAPPGGGGGGGGPPPGGGGGGGGPPPGNGGGGPPPGNGGGGGGGGPPPGGGGGGGGGGGAIPPGGGGGGGGGGPPEKQKHNEFEFEAIVQMTVVALSQNILYKMVILYRKSNTFITLITFSVCITKRLAEGYLTRTFTNNAANYSSVRCAF